MAGYSRSSWQINRILCLVSRRLSAPISWENYNRQSVLGHWLNRQSSRPCVSMSGWCRDLHQDSGAWFIHDWWSHGFGSRLVALCFSSTNTAPFVNTFVCVCTCVRFLKTRCRCHQVLQKHNNCIVWTPERVGDKISERGLHDLQAYKVCLFIPDFPVLSLCRCHSGSGRTKALIASFK